MRRPGFRIRQNTILTPFSCLNVNVAERIMRQIVRMSDIFNLNSDQPQIQNGTRTDKCPVCGHDITEQTKICPNCHETIWQDPEITNNEIDDSVESDTEEISPKENTKVCFDILSIPDRNCHCDCYSIGMDYI